MYEGHKFVFERTFMKNVLYIDDKSIFLFAGSKEKEFILIIL